ncbi:MAG: RDD family protein [Candidatus Acidiferrales bacterium]
MIKTCQHCGAVNGESAEICSACDAPLGKPKPGAVSRQRATPTEGNLAVQPEWRSEVASRLREYRVRRNGGLISDLQSTLPFEEASEPAGESSNASGSSTVTAPPEQSPRLRKLRSERFEISIPMHDAASRPGQAAHPGFGRQTPGSTPDDIFPVASLPERRRAALLDFGLLTFSYGGMLALFTVLGGRISFNRLDLLVSGATLVLFYAQYFALFTIFGGSTPGMMIRGLRVVSFDGSVPKSRQMAWRSFGYLISAGTCFLGFLWALWDEDHLCWQDRISQTYLTPIEGVGVTEPPPKATANKE